MIFFQLAIIALGMFLGLKLISKTQAWTSEAELPLWKMASFDSLAAFFGGYIIFGIMTFALSMNLEKSIDLVFVLRIGLFSGLGFAALSMSLYVLMGSIQWIRSRRS